jgi:hypothetical protein
MTDLQLALIGLGGLLVAGVWGYNVWQERKHRRRAEAMLPGAAQDVLMTGREEARDARSEPHVAEAAAPAVPREPTFAAPPPAPESVQEAPIPAEEARVVAALPDEWADGRADCLVRVEFVDAVPVAVLWEERAAWAHLVDKPMQWLGLDAGSQRWRALRPQDPGAVTQLAVALQLTDRRGPVDAAKFKAFLGGVHQLAQRFSGLVELPEQARVLQRASELDAFCAAVDLQLSLHVVPRQGSIGDLVGAKLQPVVAAAGLREEGERLVATDAAGTEVFSLICHTAAGNRASQFETLALTGLSFALDVPRVEDGAAAFDRMLALARQCADALGGQLADAHGHALPASTLDAIRARIEEIQAKMARMAIPAGSLRALRLFS